MANILVVDDHPHVLCVLEIFLARRGHVVTRADNGEAAVSLLRSKPFAVLITDVDMPKMDGLSLISHVEEINRLRGVVVLTGRTDHEAIAERVGTCKVLVVPKPFSPSQIGEWIQTILSAPRQDETTSPIKQTPAQLSV